MQIIAVAWSRILLEKPVAAAMVKDKTVFRFLTANYFPDAVDLVVHVVVYAF
jgi:hypothetical protein